MPTPSDNWKQFIAQLFKNYLAATAGAEGGPPAVATVPVYLFSDAAELPAICLTITPLQKRKRFHEYVIPFDIEFTLQTIHSGDGATTELQAEEWMQAFRRRLQDTAALDAWLAALSLEDRTGWHIPWAPTMNEEDDIEFDPESSRRTQTATMRVSLRIGGD